MKNTHIYKYARLEPATYALVAEDLNHPATEVGVSHKKKENNMSVKSFKHEFNTKVQGR